MKGKVVNHWLGCRNIEGHLNVYFGSGISIILTNSRNRFTTRGRENESKKIGTEEKLIDNQNAVRFDFLL